MKTSATIAAAWLAIACGPWLGASSSATVPAPHGIPNFSQVAPGVWRGGQPTAEGWRYLKSLGVKWDVKLNPERESSDADAKANGIQIIYLPISWMHQVFAKPARTTLEAAVSALTRPNTFVHCEHGEDRTGLVVGAYRVTIEHWTKRAAYQEMKSHGFHPLLLGLYWSWHQDVDEPGPPAKASSQCHAPLKESSARGRSSLFWRGGRDALGALARPQ